ncbi:pumilio-like mating protein m90 [Plasmopara halstedii]|uniref:Pumilio-like mating protein m90 n=1 Tax=Plasmopara halstedii TaxID=4781 RepID=A0A0P1AV15_PLAHL|nr:pumilio-like mating protein m90 [Plasmopara halstedii]CEG44497.1 pumilio-like mating protein m90 [Plasmopara halstedii]|eukprot:XP_024580866.1 pumilio-like mating protein m90 [Plasmopara halstedii]
MICGIIATLDYQLASPVSMGHSNSMSPAKSDSRALSIMSPQHATSRAFAALEKHVHHDNPVEPVRVKLQDPIGYSSDALWSSVGLKNRSSLLYSASPALSDRSANFALRAPRPQPQVGSCAVRSAQTAFPNELNEGEAAVSNQNEVENQHNVTSERAWSRKLLSKEDQLVDNQVVEPSGLSLNLHQDREIDSLSRSGENHSVNIWTNPHNGFEESDFTSNESSSNSPVGQNFPSANIPCAIPRRLSLGDSKVATCRAPPGMSLIDRIQEDFPRTPSPEYGQYRLDDFSTCKPSFGGRNYHTQSVLGVDEEIEQLKIGNYHSASSFGKQSFDNMPQTAQHTTGPRLNGMTCHLHAFGRSSSEPVFGGSFQDMVAQGYSAPYASDAYGVQGYPMANKLRWAASEDAYLFPASPFGFAPSDFASMHPSAIPTHPAGYAGEYHNTKPVNKMFMARSSYLTTDHTLFERHNFGGCIPRPQMLQRPKVGAYKRDEFEYFHPIAHSYSSNNLLEEFNSAPKSEKWGLSAIKGHLFIFAKDQTGSRFIQQKLEKADDRLKADAFNEIFPNSLFLMTDVFGNYVIQKFLEYGSLEQQQLLVELMTSNMISLALQVYGCRVIQRALEVTHVDEQLALIRQLKGHVMKCAVDQNGNHVLQKCIEAASWKRASDCNRMMPQRLVTGDDIQFIIDSFVGQAAGLSTHSYGCRVIQRVLEHCAPVQIRPLLDEIIYKCRDLVKDQFGNYVVQHVISHGEQNQRDTVMQVILPEIARWSQHKYASNVVESCLEHATKEEICQIVTFILQCDESGASCALLPMMKHMYGNYVVQKLLERVDDHDRHRIVCIIRHNEDYLKRFTFGKHVLSRLEREEQGNNYY